MRRSSATGKWRAPGSEGNWGEGSRLICARHNLEGSFTGFTRLFRINMTPERWQQVKEIFNSAITHRPEERGLFISQACSGDEELRSEVESLIASHEQSGSFIDQPAFEAAAS